jgi:hypothetical protein
MSYDGLWEEETNPISSLEEFDRQVNAPETILMESE